MNARSSTSPMTMSRSPLSGLAVGQSVDSRPTAVHTTKDSLGLFRVLDLKICVVSLLKTWSAWIFRATQLEDWQLVNLTKR